MLHRALFLCLILTLPVSGFAQDAFRFVAFGDMPYCTPSRPEAWLDRKNKHHPLRSLKRRFSPLEAGLSPCLVGLRRAAPTAQASTPTPTSAAPASPTVVLAQAQSATAARPPAPRTDAQLVALFDYWQTEQAAGRMTRDQARAEAQSLSPGDQQRLRDAVTARDAAELAAAQEAARRSEEAARRSEEAARRSEEKARLAQEELRRANERARRILGNGASPSPDSSPSNGSSPRSGGSAPSGGASPSRGGAPRSSIIFDEPVIYHGGTPGMDINITGLATSAKYNPTNRPVTLAAIVSGLPKQALHMA